MSNDTPLNDMDLDEMRRLVELDNAARAAAEVTEQLKNDPSVTVTSEVITVKEGKAPEGQADNSEMATIAPQPAYDGPGLVVDKREEKEAFDPNKAGIVNPATMNHVEKYLQTMDEEIADAEERKSLAEIDDEEVYSEPVESEKEFNEKYNTAVDVIVKTGVGSVVDFTPEERAKLEKAKTIKLEEIETKEIKTLKTKRLRKPGDLNKIIKRTTDARTTQVVLPLSGYTATMRGCSAYELMTLIDTKGNPVIDTQNKWSMIHSKIATTSIGKMDFNTFLHNTASADFNNLIYGILCATYPDDDKIPVTCANEDCKNKYEHAYSIRSLIRVEEMSDRLKDTFMKVADSSINAADAKKCHDEAAINTMKSIVLPVSEYIVEVYVQNAYDLINRSIKALSKEKDSKFAEAAIMSTMVNRILISDPDDEEGGYIEVDGPMDVSEIIYGLNDIDLNVLRTIVDDMFGDMIVSFGLMNVKCPVCGSYTATIPMDLEQLLFLKYRQAMNMTIE